MGISTSSTHPKRTTKHRYRYGHKITKLDKKIKKERKNIARLEAKLQKKKTIHKNTCETKEEWHARDCPFDYYSHRNLYDNIDDAFMFAKKYFETWWPQYTNNCGPGTAEYFIFQKARKYRCSLKVLEIYLGHKYGYRKSRHPSLKRTAPVESSDFET